MKRWAPTEGRLRLWIWALGAAVSLGFYSSRSGSPPRRTPVGSERRLFGLGSAPIALMESPTTRQWLLVRADAGAWRWMWTQSPNAAPSRRWLPGSPTGTWRLEGDATWRVWSLTTQGWLDDGRLLGSEAWWYAPWWVLDLARRRVTPTRKSEVDARQAQQEAAIAFYNDQDTHLESLSLLALPLDGLDPDLRWPWWVRPLIVGGKEVLLGYTVREADVPIALYAASDDLAPRVLRLTGNARPLALSHDGRTLFFRRSDALWRLDFRRPLTDLLAEIPAPDLPDPLAPDQ